MKNKRFLSDTKYSGYCSREAEELARKLEEEKTARLQAEKTLQETNHYYNRLISSAPVAIAIYSRGYFLFSNTAHSELMGASSSSELVGRPVLDVIDPDYHAIFEQRHKAMLEDSANAPLTSYRCRRLDGTVIDVETIAIPLRFQGAEAVMGIAVDVTEKKRAEAELERQRQQLIQADKLASLGTVASGVAHEINNPNNFIMLNISVLTRMWEDIEEVLDEAAAAQGGLSVGRLDYEQVKEKIPILCSGILEGSKRIETIVKGLKDFARPPEPATGREVDINRVIESAVELLWPIIRKSTEKFTVGKAEDLPYVRGSFQQLEQVAVNLIINACQALAATDRAVRITTSYHSLKGLVEIRVADEGEGIGEEYLEHIMDPFFTTRRDAGGTGLGLSISSRIISEHGGTISFNSKPGAGTTATVVLPAAGRARTQKRH